MTGSNSLLFWLHLIVVEILRCSLWVLQIIVLVIGNTLLFSLVFGLLILLDTIKKAELFFEV